MKIELDQQSNRPIYEQIILKIKDEIISGNMKEGNPLPSIRVLAKDLKISVITTKRAYEELEQEGLIYSQPGKGFYIGRTNQEMLKEKKIQTIEEQLSGFIKTCKMADLNKEDVLDMVDLLWQEEK